MIEINGEEFFKGFEGTKLGVSLFPGSPDAPKFDTLSEALEEAYKLSSSCPTDTPKTIFIFPVENESE